MLCVDSRIFERLEENQDHFNATDMKIINWTKKFHSFILRPSSGTESSRSFALAISA